MHKCLCLSFVEKPYLTTDEDPQNLQKSTSGLTFVRVLLPSITIISPLFFNCRF